MIRLLNAFATAGMLASPTALADLPADYNSTVQSARSGNAQSAVAMLRKWRAENPDEPKILYNLVVVLGWAGRYNEAVSHYALLSVDAPSYVLRSLAYSATMAGKTDKAEALYLAVLNKDPTDIDAVAGLVRLLVAQSRFDHALSRLKASLPLFPSAYHSIHLPLLLTLAQVHERRREWIDAAGVYQEIQRLQPDAVDAVRGRAFALQRAGLPYLAGQVARAHAQDFTADERRSLELDATARKVADGQALITVYQSKDRYAKTDEALAQYETGSSAWRRDSLMDFDRLVALRDRARMSEAVKLYESLVLSDGALPAYVKAAAADAYLYLRQPETARNLYREALKEGATQSSDALEWQIALVYANSEAERHADASQLADSLMGSTGAYRNRHVPGVEAPNPDHARVVTMAAMVRLYADRLAEAEAQLTALRRDAPFNTEIRLGWASLQRARLRPRAALEEYGLLHVDHPELIAARAGLGETMLSLDELASARSWISPLSLDYPDNQLVQRVVRRLDAYEKPLLVADTTLGREDGRRRAENISNARLYSAPLTASLGDRYRGFAHVGRASGDINSTTSGTGERQRSVSRTMAGVGIDFRKNDLRIEGELNRAHGSTSRTGIAIAVNYALSDAWQFAAAGNTNINELPAAVIAEEGYASVARIGLTWRRDESRSLGAAVEAVRISDGNHRRAASLIWQERWVSGPVFMLNTALAATTSRNSRSDVIYFSPPREHEATLSVGGDYLIWRSYERSFKQRVTASFGRYWQRSFGSSPVRDVRYEHEWLDSDWMALQYGIGQSTHSYDGAPEDRTYGFVRLNWTIK